MTKVQPIVEGYGEVSALPVLLRRLQVAAQSHSIDFGRPIRRKRSQLVQQQPLRDSVKLALKQADCRAIVIVFDSDDDCPRVLAPQLQAWACQAAGQVPCSIVIANKEYEAWFLASIESLRGKRNIRADAAFDGDPEGVRDAKGALENLMGEGVSYLETADQAALSAEFDLKTAYAKCRSFKKFVKSFGELVRAVNVELPVWPPADWMQGSA